MTATGVHNSWEGPEVNCRSRWKDSSGESSIRFRVWVISPNSSLAGCSATRRVRSPPPENFIYASNDAVYRLQGTLAMQKPISAASEVIIGAPWREFTEKTHDLSHRRTGPHLANAYLFDFRSQGHGIQNQPVLA